MKLLLGTANPAKIADYQKYLVHSKLEIVTLKDLQFFDEALEIGKTFEENALQKARFYAEKTELATLADDGGFEVDFLDGRPGIDSNRWLGPNATDEDKVNKILELLTGVPEEQRTARLRNVTVIYFPMERDYLMSEGKMEGVVPDKPSFARLPGFPYRSVLFLPRFNKYYAELEKDESHRKAICKELLLKLEPYLN